jgi:hypothetical protein
MTSDTTKRTGLVCPHCRQYRHDHRNVVLVPCSRGAVTTLLAFASDWLAASAAQVCRQFEHFIISEGVMVPALTTTPDD